MIKKITFHIAFLAALIYAFTSCQKYYDKTYEDYDFVKLKYDNEVDFSRYKTYTLVDSIAFVRDTVYNGENGYPDFNIDMDKNTNGEYSKSVIAKVRENLNRMGLNELPEGSGEIPDLCVNISSMTLKQVSSYTWFPNDIYNPWWGGGSHWNNDYTWGVTNYYASNNGMLSIDMFDVLNAMRLRDGKMEVKSLWRGSFEGIVGPTSESYTQRVLGGVQDIFDYEGAF
ncbi:MAG: DUF4136 domain-containing protein [Bacteroidota bacterium]